MPGSVGADNSNPRPVRPTDDRLCTTMCDEITQIALPIDQGISCSIPLQLHCRPRLLIDFPGYAGYPNHTVTGASSQFRLDQNICHNVSIILAQPVAREDLFAQLSYVFNIDNHNVTAWFK